MSQKGLADRTRSAIGNHCMEYQMVKYLFFGIAFLAFASCNKKEVDPMKECMETMSHQQCVKKLSQESNK